MPPLTDNDKTATRLGLRRHRALAIAVSSIVSVASVWYVGWTFQWCELGHVLRNVNLTCLVAGGGASIMSYWMLRTLRWHILLRRTDTHVPLTDLYLCTAVSLSFALFTPLQSGEMLKVELLKKYGMIQRAPGYGSFLVEGTLDLVILLAMACVSLVTVLNILPNRAHAYAILLCLALVCVAGMLALAKLRLRGRLQQLLESMRQCVGDMPTLFMIIVITCVSWASVAISWQVFLYAGGIHLDFTKAVALMSIVALISVLSLIPGGLGVSETGAAQVLLRFGSAGATAQAMSSMIQPISLVAIVPGGIHLGLLKMMRTRQIHCDSGTVGCGK